MSAIDRMRNTGQSAREFWEEFYTDNAGGEHGPVGRQLVTEVEGLTPGMALDLGCGEGSDAIWLAQQGWQVTAVDVSATALDRARDQAKRLGLGDRLVFERHDLGEEFPTGTFDLVSAQFLHSPVAVPGERERILRQAAQAVAPGGHLLVLSHQGFPSWVTEHPIELTLPTPEQTIAALQLADGAWVTVRTETVTVEVTSPDGVPGTREDHVLHYRRADAAA